MADNTGIVEAGDVSYEVNFSFIPQIEAGDYVIVHAGFAIQKIDKEEADERINLFKELETYQ